MTSWPTSSTSLTPTPRAPRRTTGCSWTPSATAASRASPRRDRRRSVGVTPTDLLRSARAASSTGAEVISDDVLAETVGVRLEHPAAGPLGDVVHEVHQPGVGVEREDVDRRAGAGHPLHLGDRAR